MAPPLNPRRHQLFRSASSKTIYRHNVLMAAYRWLMRLLRVAMHVEAIVRIGGKIARS